MILLMVGLSGMSDALLPVPLDLDYPVIILYTQAGATILFSSFGILGTILAFRGNANGYPYLLIAGIMGILGTFFPISSSVAGGILLHIFYLIDTFLYVDLVLMLVGGVLGLALDGKKRGNN